MNILYNIIENLSITIKTFNILIIAVVYQTYRNNHYKKRNNRFESPFFPKFDIFVRVSIVVDGSNYGHSLLFRAQDSTLLFGDREEQESPLPGHKTIQLQQHKRARGQIKPSNQNIYFIHFLSIFSPVLSQILTYPASDFGAFLKFFPQISVFKRIEKGPWNF